MCSLIKLYILSLLTIWLCFQCCNSNVVHTKYTISVAVFVYKLKLVFSFSLCTCVCYLHYLLLSSCQSSVQYLSKGTLDHHLFFLSCIKYSRPHGAQVNNICIHTFCYLKMYGYENICGRFYPLNKYSSIILFSLFICVNLFFQYSF